MAQPTFLVYDYETFGLPARVQSPATFAAQRYDLEFNPIGEPLSLMCCPRLDVLPDVAACMLTGISPMRAMNEGMAETLFAKQINEIMSVPGTIGMGYNTIGFDDEVTRFLFWRNLIDPYAREWQNGNTRWDLMDVARCAWALRPEGMNWPEVNGKPSFKLELLTQANGLLHEQAHSALSDVQATVELAKLLRQKQPRFFDYCLENRFKNTVAERVGIHSNEQKAFLLCRMATGVKSGFLQVLTPLGMSANDKNEVLCWNLSQSPGKLQEALDAGSLEGLKGITRVSLNKAPVVIDDVRTLSAERAQQFGIDLEQALARLPEIAQLRVQAGKVLAQGSARPKFDPVDVDEALYEGFLSDGDRINLNRVFRSLKAGNIQWTDQRLPKLVERFLARNLYEPLEDPAYRELVKNRLVSKVEGFQNLFEFDAAIAKVRENAEATPQQLLMADSLEEYSSYVKTRLCPFPVPALDRETPSPNTQGRGPRSAP